MSPELRLVIRALIAGTLTALGILQAALPGISLDDGITALISGLIAALVLASAEWATPLNSIVGLGKDASPT